MDPPFSLAIPDLNLVEKALYFYIDFMKKGKM